MAGSVQAQQRVAQTPFWTTQSGYAIGLTEYPLPATRLWLTTPGVYYMPDQVVGGYTTPENFGINEPMPGGFLGQHWEPFASLLRGSGKIDPP